MIHRLLSIVATLSALVGIWVFWQARQYADLGLFILGYQFFLAAVPLAVFAMLTTMWSWKIRNELV